MGLMFIEILFITIDYIREYISCDIHIIILKCTSKYVQTPMALYLYNIKLSFSAVALGKNLFLSYKYIFLNVYSIFLLITYNSYTMSKQW